MKIYLFFRFRVTQSIIEQSSKQSKAAEFIFSIQNNLNTVSLNNTVTVLNENDWRMVILKVESIFSEKKNKQEIKLEKGREQILEKNIVK